MGILTNMYFLCGIIYLFIGIFIFTKDKKNLNKIFCLLCIDLTFWAFSFGLINNSIDAVTASKFYRYSTFFWTTVYSLILHFIMILTGNEGFLKNRFRYVIFYSPALISIYLYFFMPLTTESFTKTNLGWVHYLPKDMGFVWDNFFNVYYLSYMLISLFYILTWIRTTKKIRERKQAKVILITVFIALVLGSFTDIFIPMVSSSEIPSVAIVLCIIPITGIFYSIIKYKLMDLNPENFILEVFKIMNEGLVILDDNYLIKYVNYGALKLLDYEKSEIKHRCISDIILDLKEISNIRNCTSVEIDMISRNNEKIPVLISSSILKDKWGDILGIVCMFQNISEIKMAREKLENAYDNLEGKVKERTIKLSEVNKELEKELMVRIEMEEKIKNLVYYDQLTGINNRRYFEEELQRLNNLCNLPLTIIVADLNGLKLINDSFGHIQGDKLIKKVAEIMKRECKSEDVCARIGGDEFVIILPKTEKEEGDKLIKRMKNLFQKEKIENIEVSVSFGCETKRKECEVIEEILKKAEDHMYKIKTIESQNMRENAVKSIIKTLYEKNKWEEFHSHRVSDLCVNIGKAINLSEKEIDNLKSAALLHDIGKVAISESILNKADNLTKDELLEIQSHPEIGYRMLNAVKSMEGMAENVLYHHERWDGKGYPKGLKGVEIPIASRIIGIVDAYDSITTDKNYKSAQTEEVAIQEILNNSGSQFDPELSKMFIEKVLNSFK